MGEIDSELSEAVVLCLEFGKAPLPSERPLVLSKRFGPDKAIVLEQQIASLLEEFYEIDVDWSGGVGLATDRKQKEMQLRHPELSNEATYTLASSFFHNSR